jgi:predicted N-acetyltransferase YhbS
VPIEVRVAGVTIEGVGLGGVLVHRDHRGSGVGGPLVSGAMDRMREEGRPLGLLFCRPERLRFYRALGWEEVEHPVTADQVDRPAVVMPLRTCWTALGPGASAPSADLHIDGLPF